MTSTEGTQLKIITFNVYQLEIGPFGVFAKSPDRKERLDRLGPWLKGEAADVVFLQEVLKHSQFKKIVAESKMPYSYWSKESALAILSKHRLNNPQYENFRWQASTKLDCKRLSARWWIGLATATLHLSTGEEIFLAATHAIPRHESIEGFADPADQITPERKVHILEMVEGIRSRIKLGVPLIFAGDFNMNQASEEYRFFAEVSGLQDAYRSFCESRGFPWEELCTYCEQNPYVKAQGNPGEGILDYIMISPGDFEILGARISKEADKISDHRAVEVKLQTNPGAANGFVPSEVDPFELSKMKTYFERVKIDDWIRLAPSAARGQLGKIKLFLKQISEVNQ